MTDTSYNGWTNYETWLVNVWLTNEEGTSNYWNEAARDCITDCGEDTAQAIARLEQELKDNLEEQAPDLGSGLYADMLSAALASVNWRELSKALIEGATE